MKICSIEGCNGKHKGYGYCRKHYQRYKKHGDPLCVVVEYHGMTKTSEYEAWQSMKDRCYNKNNPRYKDWGGNGIMICDRWRSSFLDFYIDMGPKPFPKAQLDRINNDGNYEPDNCHWTTCTINNRNRSCTKLSMEKAREIREKYKAGKISHKSLGVIYGIGARHIGFIINNDIWKETV